MHWLEFFKKQKNPQSSGLPKATQLIYCPSNLELYDDGKSSSILERGRLLEGNTFIWILEQNGLSQEVISEIEKASIKNKGLLGNIIESGWFGISQNSDQAPDFPKAGVELKSSACDDSKDESLHKYVPGETLSITQIDNSHSVQHNFENSHCYEKVKSILLVYYHRQRNLIGTQLKSKLWYQIVYAEFLNPTNEDLMTFKGIQFIQRDHPNFIRIINSRISPEKALVAVQHDF